MYAYAPPPPTSPVQEGMPAPHTTRPMFIQTRANSHILARTKLQKSLKQSLERTKEMRDSWEARIEGGESELQANKEKMDKAIESADSYLSVANKLIMKVKFFKHEGDLCM